VSDREPHSQRPDPAHEEMGKSIFPAFSVDVPLPSRTAVPASIPEPAGGAPRDN
jgi:hypothetical protein